MCLFSSVFLDGKSAHFPPLSLLLAHPPRTLFWEKNWDPPQEITKVLVMVCSIHNKVSSDSLRQPIIAGAKPQSPVLAVFNLF
jgi:hypothetical protein